jgi:hypothetical protein
MTFGTRAFPAKDGWGWRFVAVEAGRQFQDDMSSARANQMRAERVQGKSLSRKEARQTTAEIKWTVDRL